MKRRSFLAGTAATMAKQGSAQTTTEKVSVGVIGHTGRGNYGHGLDTVWLKSDQTEIVAVADANADGLAKALERLKTSRGFRDYRKMFREVRPTIVAICPRHADQHHDMAMAAIGAGARGIYVEKPLCRTPAEADALVAACRQNNVKLAVAHRNRYHPVLQSIDKMIGDGAIGRLLEIRGRGKGDRRGGAEDLWVLGSHVLNLMHYFGGDPKSCSAVLLQGGRPVVKTDVKHGAEGLGPLAGDELHARYEMSRGVVAYFDSIANDGTGGAGFGLQMIGSQGVIAIQCDRRPLALLSPGNPFQTTGQPRRWVPISTAGAGAAEPRADVDASVSSHISAAQDLIDAVVDDREPICDVIEGATTVEMICAAFESHRQGGRTIRMPTEERGNALAKL